MLDKFDVPTEKFGDSNGMITILKRPDPRGSGLLLSVWRADLNRRKVQ